MSRLADHTLYFFLEARTPRRTYFSSMSSFFCSSDVGLPICGAVQAHERPDMKEARTGRPSWPGLDIPKPTSFMRWSNIIFSTMGRVSSSRSASREFSG